MKQSRVLELHPCLIAILLLAVAPAGVFAQDTALQKELDELKQKVAELDNLAVRTQSHIMMDVEYQFANLWFAAKAEQWDLAAFYLRETRSHLDWTVRVRPVRKTTGGGTVELRPFQQAIESGFTMLGTAVDAHDAQSFESAYRQTLPQCHACHAAAGLGYLEPHIPERAPSVLMIEHQ